VLNIIGLLLFNWLHQVFGGQDLVCTSPYSRSICWPWCPIQWSFPHHHPAVARINPHHPLLLL